MRRFYGGNVWEKITSHIVFMKLKGRFFQSCVAGLFPVRDTQSEKGMDTMMKKSKVTVLAAILVLAFMLVGCSDSKPVTFKEYKSENATYSISVPDDWIQDTEYNMGMLLSNKDKTLNVAVQQFSKAALAGQFSTGEDFVAYYRENVTIKIGVAKDVDNLTISTGKIIKTEEYQTSDILPEKAHITYLETDAAFYVILLSGEKKRYEKNFDTLKKSAEQFTEDTALIESLIPKLSDTLLWFNGTYGIITVTNGANINLVGGYEMNAENQAGVIKGLEGSWNVTDKATADENLKWLVEEGHNLNMIQVYTDNKLEEFTRDELVEALPASGITGQDAVTMLVVYDAVKQFGDKAIKAWDLSRAMQLSAWYYIAGYYTYEEAMDKSMEIATVMQQTFSSWDEMMENYLYGFQYWNGDDIADTSSESYQRKTLYDTLKAQKGSPYQLDWKLTFSKDW